MWWRRGALLGLALLVAGCGFRPLYGDAGGERGHALPGVQVGLIAEREGQTLWDALRRAFRADSVPDWRLDVRLDERLSTLAIDADGSAIRRRMTVTADWRLTPVDTTAGRKPITGRNRALESFNVLRSDYANLSAERSARARASERLADIISTAIAARLEQAE